MVISLPGENKTDNWFDYKNINAVIMFLYEFIGISCSPTNQPEVFCKVPRPLLLLLLITITINEKNESRNYKIKKKKTSFLT